jgi:hypothetical protein
MSGELVRATFRSIDHTWVRELLQTNNGVARYADSWLYLAQATRRDDGSLGDYLRYPGFFAGLTTHRGHLVLVRPTGLPPDTLLVDLHALIDDAGTDRRVYFKKAPATFRLWLRHIDWAPVDVGEMPWDDLAPHDDDTFPEVVVSTERAVEMLRESGAASRKLRSKWRQAVNLGSDLNIRPADASDRWAIVAMLTDYFDGRQRDVSAYLNMLDSIVVSEGRYFGALVADVSGSLTAFFVYEIFHDKSAGIYASIAQRKYPGLSECMMLHVFDELLCRGVELVNLGGSETSGLHAFKQKFSPMTFVHNPIKVFEVPPL